MFSQEQQQPVSLHEIEIRTYRTRLEGVGKKTESFDSLQQQRFAGNDISQLLAQEAGVFIKNYGPGNIATSTLRGGNAAQTAIVWNGINIQNRMLGQLDLSQLPVFMFDAINVDYGGSSASWGSGAVAGSILLSNTSNYYQGKQLQLFATAGSFNRAGLGLRYSDSRDFSTSTTRLFINSGANNYHFTSALTGQTLQLQHAQSQLATVMQEFTRRLPKGRELSVNLWLLANNHALPNYITNTSKASEFDNAIRANARYLRYHGKTRYSSMLAVLRDGINYTDSTSLTRSQSAVNSVVAELDNLYHWRKHVLEYAINGTGAWANSTAFTGTKQLLSAAAMLANRFSFYHERLIVQVNVRQELYSTKANPFTFNAGAAIASEKFFQLKINTAKIFRQPSFNELYWQPGGNAQLKPEQGYSADGGVVAKAAKNGWAWYIEGSAFARLISNWILWLPGKAGQATPVNVQEVFSRGTETVWKLSKLSKKHTLSLQVRSSYVLATVRASSLVNDASVGKQLIYTPRYSGNATLHYRFKNVFIEWLQQYAGYRFTASDNESWLAPYHLSSLRLGIEPSTKMPIQISVQCNNIFNAEYAVVAARPLPFRNYQIQLIYKLNFKKKQNQ